MSEKKELKSNLIAVFDCNIIDINIVHKLEDFLRKDIPELKFGTGFDTENNRRDWFFEGKIGT